MQHFCCWQSHRCIKLILKNIKSQQTLWCVLSTMSQWSVCGLCSKHLLHLRHCIAFSVTILDFWYFPTGGVSSSVLTGCGVQTDSKQGRGWFSLTRFVVILCSCNVLSPTVFPGLAVRGAVTRSVTKIKLRVTALTISMQFALWENSQKWVTRLMQMCPWTKTVFWQIFWAVHL